MRALVIALVAAPTTLVIGSIASGCLKKPTFECASAAQCEGVGAGATCEADGFCSFSDGSCESGRRYGDNSGPNAGQCVGAIPIDAAIDMPPDSPPIDARLCYGAGAYALCLASEPMGMEMLAGAIDTDTDTRCAAVQPTEWVTANQPATCFISAAQITVNGAVTVTGTRPLALLADSIVINAVIDVSSHRGAAANGAGANSALCTTFTVAPTDATPLAGGGAGGSFMTSGGNGARGDNNAGIPGGLATGAEGAPPTILRGGCPGQLGGTGAGAAGTPGPGGGAIFVSASTIAIGSGGGINASGAAAGAGAASGSGSGAGSGGMIVLHATSITNAGAIIANGGGGASGGTLAAAGAPGSEPSVANPTTPAAGGAGGGGGGGDGFAGNTQATNGGNANNRAGAGGGGGGGYIQSNININGSVSPAETVVP